MDENKNKSQSSEKRKHSHRHDKLCEYLSFAAKEAFKRLRTNVVLRFPDGDQPGHIIGVTSAQPTEGKSTIAINLAYSLAELGKRVLLVDADMRRSSIHKKLGLENSPGLSDLMADSNSINTALRNYKSSKDSTSFDIIPGGTLPSNPSEILNSKRMETFLHTLATAYDYILLDLPPVGVVTDAVAISTQTDGMLFVMRESHCPRGLLADCVTQLQEAKANILGFVVNGALEGSGKKYGYRKGYYGKGYYGSYGGYGGYGNYGS